MRGGGRLKADGRRRGPRTYRLRCGPLEQVVDDIGCGVRRATAQEVPDRQQVVATGEQRRLLPSVRPDLREPDVRHERVAQASAVHRRLDRPSFFDVRIDRLSRATVAEAAVRSLVGDAKPAEVADPRPGLGTGRGRIIGPAYDLEWIAGWRGTGIGEDVHRPAASVRQD